MLSVKSKQKENYFALKEIHKASHQLCTCVYERTINTP